MLGRGTAVEFYRTSAVEYLFCGQEQLACNTPNFSMTQAVGITIGD